VAADPITAADVRAAAQDVYDRLKHEMAEQARNTLLNDLARLLNAMDLHLPWSAAFVSGYEQAQREVRAWMNEQAPTEGEA
jgi:hypothetical protein